MGCRNLTYYEKSASPLMVLPENDKVTVIVEYQNEFENGKVVQGWFTPDPAEQFLNPYLAMGRTKREEWELGLPATGWGSRISPVDGSKVWDVPKYFYRKTINERSWLYTLPRRF